MSVPPNETEGTAAKGSDDPKLTPAKAAGVLLGLVVVLAVYVYLAHVLGLIALFAGNLVLFYWAGIDHFKMRALPAVVAGSLGGILNGALFALLPPLIGEGPGSLIALLILLGAIYFLILQWLPLIFNNAYMLLLNVALIPAVLGEGRFLEMSAAVLFSAAFWGGLVFAGARIASGRAARKAAGS